MDEDDLDKLIEGLKARRAAKSKPVPMKAALKRTQLSPDAPAPATQALVARRGEGAASEALDAWGARVAGASICDVAHKMGCSIETAKKLIAEAHTAIAEDLKTNLNLNRELDLARIDGLIASYYGPARSGDTDSANIVLKCLTHRAGLTGSSALPDPGRSHPENVILWIQNQLPSITKIVDALPLD
jgi:hypothetical protein